MVPSLPARYQDPRRLAAGGMATVYAAQDTLLGRQVAIKVLHAHVLGDADARERFTREARAAARVSDHPHVVTIYDIGEQDGTPFIVMELLSGGSVADRLRQGRIPHGTALRWLEEAAGALDHAHKHDIVHRDVKPANLLLDERDRLAVADFGIARIATDHSGLTQTGLVLGTAAYLSPEQALGRPAIAASDRYALAVVAFELLTGERPFKGDTVAAQAHAHAETAPPAASAIDPQLLRAVDRVLRRGMDKDAALRWGTARRMVEALEDAMAQAPTRRIAATSAPPPPPPLAPPARRRIPTKVLAGAAALIAGAAIAFVALGGGSNNDAPGRVAAHTATDQTAASKSKPKAKHKPKAHKAGKPKTVTQTETQVVTQTAPPPDTAATTETTAPAPPAGGDPSALQAQGHQMIASGDPAGAIPVLQQAVADCPVSQTDPCAYAYFDLGHALRLAGRPQEAIPVLQTRLQNPDQHGTVEAELRQAQHEAS
jgi:serine/threonine-protein kinase